MTVKQLIAKLKKMPQNLNVYWADHDHGQYEINSTAGCVEHIFEPDKEDEFDHERYHHERKGYEDSTDEEYVVIRP